MAKIVKIDELIIGRWVLGLGADIKEQGAGGTEQNRYALNLNLNLNLNLLLDAPCSLPHATLTL